VSPELFGYRRWRGTLGSSLRAIWPIARVGLKMVFRQKLFWVLYGLALMTFLINFFGIYLFSQVDTQMLSGQNRPGGAPPAFMGRVLVDIKNTIQRDLKLSGNVETYRNFYFLQGYYVMVVLALAGATIIGNDYRHGSLAFYLSKPMGRWHYLLGKMLTVFTFSVLMTLVPALVLYLECSLLMDESYAKDHLPLLRGVIGYGAAIAVVLGVTVIAVATAVRRTAPLVMVWLLVLAVCPVVAALFVDRLGYSPNWRLIDLWNNLYVVGSWLLNVSPESTVGPRGFVRKQPDVLSAVIVLASVVSLSLVFLHRRIRAVEVVT
jgi:ABC-2 type transport system permease protein